MRKMLFMAILPLLMLSVIPSRTGVYASSESLETPNEGDYLNYHVVTFDETGQEIARSTFNYTFERSYTLDEGGTTLRMFNVSYRHDLPSYLNPMEGWEGLCIDNRIVYENSQGIPYRYYFSDIINKNVSMGEQISYTVYGSNCSGIVDQEKVNVRDIEYDCLHVLVTTGNYTGHVWYDKNSGVKVHEVLRINDIYARIWDIWEGRLADSDYPTFENTLAVYIGAHPDDVDIGISGRMYKYDFQKHPILWIVVTDGGSDEGEYKKETEWGWYAKDAQYNLTWTTPDNNTITRQFYSFNLAKSRCGGYIQDDKWIEESVQHDSVFGAETDWRTRVSNMVDPEVERIQLSYTDPSNLSRQLMYPDSGLWGQWPSYRDSIADELANVIMEVVEAHGYRKDRLFINSHAPEGIFAKGGEHGDHVVTGNAVVQAINRLRSDCGFEYVVAHYYRISGPLEPNCEYRLVAEDVSQYHDYKMNLGKACWEMCAIVDNDPNGSKEEMWHWANLPNNPGDWEYSVIVDYESTLPQIENILPDPSEGSIEPYCDVGVSATIIDDESGTKRATLVYAFFNESVLWVASVEMTNVEGQIWNATMPAFVPGTNVTVIITAEDNAGNTVSSQELGYTCQYYVVQELAILVILPFLFLTSLVAVAARELFPR
jgi:hypothetical protein